MSPRPRLGREGRFRFTRQMGQRLRELRRRSGLRQVDVAREMTGKARHVLVSQLETGTFANPSVGLLAEYLRAVGAKWADIAGLLDSYTGQPRPSEVEARKRVAEAVATLPSRTASAVREYDRETARKREEQKKPAESVEARTLRSRKLAAAFGRRHKVASVLRLGASRETLGTEPVLTTCAFVVTFGQKLWGILSRTRKRGTDRRPALLDEATDWMRGQKVLPEQALEWTRETVQRLFLEMEKRGELDRLPGVAKGRRAPGAGEQRRLKRERYQRELDRYQTARNAVVEQLWSAARQMAGIAGPKDGRALLWLGLVRHVCYVVDWCGGDKAAQEREIEAYINDEARQRRGLEPGLARGIARAVARRYQKLRTGLPPSQFESGR